MIKRIKRPVSILLAVLTAASLLAVTIVTAGATCTPISSNAVVNYSADNTRIESIDIDFAYFDNGIWPANAAGRYYNMIFTTDARLCTMSTSFQGGGSWEPIARNIGSTAIYSVNDELDSSSINYDFRNNGAEVSGSYTIDDADIFSRLKEEKHITAYYAQDFRTVHGTQAPMQRCTFITGLFRWRTTILLKRPVFATAAVYVPKPAKAIL